MRILVLGGTIFVGRHFVEAALERGHEVTLFHRGQHSPGLFPQAETIQGDRDGGLEALAGRSWDAVLDTCGYVPRVVRDSARFLKDKVGHYTFVSSVSVYADFKKPGIDESYPVGRLENPTVEKVDCETYGPLKALCEEAAEEELPGKTLIVRPGLIVGPHDLTDRFTYWPRRIARGGEVLAPAPSDRKVQIIDVRDLTRWMLSMIETGKTGVYNATGPEPPLTFRSMLDGCETAIGTGARITWVDEAFLVQQQVGQWMELPLWVAEEPGMEGFSEVDTSRARKDGLTFLPLVLTVRDTLAWDNTRPMDRTSKAGLDPQKEETLLRLWHGRADGKKS